jgi:glycosyltransferase involved in cell wall biosynthesis
MAASLRILEVSPYYEWAWGYGGVPRVVPLLAAGLAGLGHDVTVCTTDARDGGARAGPDERAAASARRSSPRVDVEVFTNLSNAAAYHLQLFLPRGLGAWLERRAGDFDVAHLHSCRNLPVSLAARSLRRAGVPYVVAPHGTAPRIERRRFLKRLYDLSVGRLDLRGAAACQAVSEAERRQLIALGIDPRRIEVVGNPIDRGEFDRVPAAGAFRREFGIGDERLALYLGRLSPRKRIDLLLRGFAALDDPRARLVIAGNDQGAAAGLRRLARSLGIAERVTWPGLLEGEWRLAALRDADVVVNPAVDEVFGLVPVEAVLCGTPVIVTADCGAPEVFERIASARVIETADPGALARAMAELSGTARGARAASIEDRRSLLERFDAGRVCRRLEALFREVVARGPAGSEALARAARAARAGAAAS